MQSGWHDLEEGASNPLLASGKAYAKLESRSASTLLSKLRMKYSSDIMKNQIIANKLTLVSLALGLGLSSAAVAQTPTSEPMKMDHKKMMASATDSFAHVTELIATIKPVSGSNVKGSVIFKKIPTGVEVTVSIGGLEPGTEHGFHIHEFGDVTSDDGKSTGGHYNPEGHDHALPDKGMRHAGDLGNLMADAEGNAKKTITVENISLTGPDNAIIGRGVVVHAKKDDGGQPTGNAGDRIGVGVIGISKVEDTKK